MKKNIAFIVLIIFLSNLLFVLKINAIEEKDLVAKSAILMDKETGRVLFEKNADVKMAMASTTKIMTCIVALESADLDDEITVSKLATRAPEVKLYLKEGERYKLGDLLYALMLESSNDVAIAIAEGVSGSVENFCILMTEKAKTLGAINTAFKTPNGLDAEGHYTTAYDLALITKYALDNEKFDEIINTPSHSFSELNQKRNFTVNNKNAFLNMYEGANGVKTGYTGDAGLCFVGSAQQEDKELIVVLLACSWPPNKTHRWADTIKLMNYGFDNYSYKNILDNEKIVFKIDKLKYAVEDEVEGITTKDVTILCREDEKIDIIYNMKPINEAPIEKDELLGEAIIYLNGEVYCTVDIIATKTVERIDFKYCFNYVVEYFTSIL